jgi:Flp pilus assembly protein TadD
VAVWEEALRRDPNNQDMLMGLGTTLYAEGQYARAVPYLRRAVALTEDDWTLRLFTASVLIWQARKTRPASSSRPL